MSDLITVSFLMRNLFQVSFLAVFLLILAVIVRVVKGPHVADRLVGFSTINTLLITVFILVGVFFNNVIYVDVAIVYGLLSFVGTLFIARYLGGEV